MMGKAIPRKWTQEVSRRRYLIADKIDFKPEPIRRDRGGTTCSAKGKPTEKISQFQHLCDEYTGRKVYERNTATAKITY